MSPELSSPAHRRLLPTALLLLLAAAASGAATPPCQPCLGIEVVDPAALLEAIAAEPGLNEGARLYVAWNSSAAGLADTPELTHRVVATGAIPWLRVRFDTPAPLADHALQLEAELEALATAARGAASTTHYEIEWTADGSNSPQYANLLKRAAVALTGAAPEARVLARPADTAASWLSALYDEEIAAYVDGIAVPDRTVGEELVTLLQSLDPGKPVVTYGRALPADASLAAAEAARQAADGAAVTFFSLGSTEPGSEAAALLTPLKVAANRFRGEDLSFDPYSSPPGAWAFVRGEDLSLMVVFDRSVAGSRLEFADTTLRQPRLVDLTTGASEEVFGLGRTATGLTVPIDGAGAAGILDLQRPDLADLVGETGLAEEVTITTERTMPVSEILRRLQANEDDQTRRLDHYEAVNTTHLRFEGGTGVRTVEATFEGPFFAVTGEPYDWSWESFYVNGVRWRSKRIPEIPLVQPEKAATLPLEINFDRDYRYSLRGTDTIEGRDCWVVDFEPVAGAAGNRYQGTVWIDRQEYLRVRTRALQIGLTGEVISNDETLYYSPLDAAGNSASWETAEFTLPLRVVSQQIFSVLNATVNVEKETLLAQLRINDDGFASRRQAIRDGETTMVRDTEEGLRFLVADKETGERVVQEEFDKTRLFLVGGVFYDESLDFPLPLAGVNWFSFDFKGTGAQANLFFAGVLANGTISDPDFLGSRWDAGAEAFVLGIPFTNSTYRDGVEVPDEDVELQSSNVSFTLGRPVGNYLKLSAEYQLTSLRFGRADDTGEEFVVPEDHLLHSLEFGARFARSGYRLRLEGSYNKRSDWSAWGMPDEPFDPETDAFVRWGVRAAKNFHLSSFRRFGVEVEYLDGENLDRFSKYGFGYFSDAQVHGYESGLVQAESATVLRTSYGFEIGELFRLEAVADAAWATDEPTGLDNELLAGVGVAGTFLGPWQTVVNLDVGVPVAGPDDDGFTLFLAFLKLFK